MVVVLGRAGPPGDFIICSLHLISSLMLLLLLLEALEPEGKQQQQHRRQQKQPPTSSLPFPSAAGSTENA